MERLINSGIFLDCTRQSDPKDRMQFSIPIRVFDTTSSAGKDKTLLSLWPLPAFRTRCIPDWNNRNSLK